MTPAERAAFIASQRAYLSTANNQPQLALDDFFSSDSSAPGSSPEPLKSVPVTPTPSAASDATGIDDEEFTPATSAPPVPAAEVESPSTPDFGLLSSALDDWRSQADDAMTSEAQTRQREPEPETIAPLPTAPTERLADRDSEPVRGEATPRASTNVPEAKPVQDVVPDSTPEPLPTADVADIDDTGALIDVDLPPWYAQDQQPTAETDERFDDDAGLEDVVSDSAMTSTTANNADDAIEKPVTATAAMPAKPVSPTATSGTSSAWLHADKTKAPTADWDDEGFELHVDPEAIAGTQPVFGDWHLDQSNTVAAAEERDVLNRAAGEVDAGNKADVSTGIETADTAFSADPRAVAAGNARKATDDRRQEPKLGVNEVDPDAIVPADFGDIGTDWDKPPVQLRATEPVSTAPVEIERFDADSFTADADGRVYGGNGTATEPALDDPFAGFGADPDWTLTPTEPREDYEALLHPRHKRRFPWRGLLLVLLALLLIAVLVSQLLWPQRGVLREDPQWGPWVEQVCAQIDCELPPRVDLNKVKLQQKSVLKDRTDPRKLQIDLLVSNTAEFAQPYPDIRLRFTNIEGEMVAERRFKPEEYLRERPEAALMPSNIPIHIAFAVKAPDGNITGYEFEFLPPQQP